MSSNMLPADFDVETVIKSLTLTEKCKIMTGKGMFWTNDLPERGIPLMKFGDGPSSCRGSTVFNGKPANCFPCATAMGSAFDDELTREISLQIAEEARSKGVHVLLSPTLNLHRSPLGGRVFEFLSEDPYLAGKFASVYIAGVQSKGIAVCAKHFLGNEQEFEKHRSTSVMSPRAMREIYLEPFRMAVKNGKPWSFMTAYNKIMGVPTSESEFLLRDVLRGEWEWEGMIMCDFGGMHSCEGSIKAGVDLEMPGPPMWRTPRMISTQIDGGHLDMEDVDACIRNIFFLLKKAMISGLPFNTEDTSIDTPYTRELLRRAAAATTVLLKNDASLLPLTPEKQGKRLVVIGGAALQCYTSGGGSASSATQPFFSSPLDGITGVGSEAGFDVSYAFGYDGHKYVPFIDPHMAHPDGRSRENEKAVMEFWDELPCEDWREPHSKVDAKQPDYSMDVRTAKCYVIDGMPEEIRLSSNFVKYTTDFIPPMDGDWLLGYCAFDRSLLFVDGELVIDYRKPSGRADVFYSRTFSEQRAVLKNAKAGKRYRIEMRTWKGEREFDDFDWMPCCFRIGASMAGDESQLIEAAAQKAKESDIAVVVVGLYEDYEQEGMDREHWELPGASDKLVEAVLAANPNTIVVSQGGTSVYMPWAKTASTIIQQFYGGSALGLGLADIIFGRVNPSAKLSISIPEYLEDMPAHLDSGYIHPSKNEIFYHEDIFLGYRGFDRRVRKALFPFGHGLSFTTFEFSDLVVPETFDLSTADSDWNLEVSVKIKNTGSVAGRGVAQLYIRDVASSIVRPVKELKGYAGAFLEPGESKKVTIQLERNAFAFWQDGDRDGWVAEKGDFEILIAESSVDIRLTGKTRLTETAKWKGL